MALSFLPGYRRACPLTVAAAQITGTLADPVFVVSAANMPSGAWSGADSFSFEDLRDLRFTLVDGTPLNHELVQGSKAGSLLQAHVHLPSAAVGSVIYPQWQNPGAAMPTTAFQQATWGDGTWVAVWHLDAASGNQVDSTGNGNTLTPTGSPAYQSSGIIGKGVGPGAYSPSTGFTCAGIVVPAVHTISMWAYLSSAYNDLHNYSGLVCGGASAFEALFKAHSGSNQGWYFKWNSVGGAYYPFIFDAWQHVASVTASPGTVVTGYLNGALVYTSGALTAASATGVDVLYDPTDATYGYWPGYFDELRIANTGRTSAWLTAERNNGFAPGSFWTTGSILYAPSDAATAMMMAGD